LNRSSRALPGAVAPLFVPLDSEIHQAFAQADGEEQDHDAEHDAVIFGQPRILNEAEFFAPIGYQKHLDNISTAYVRILRRARHGGAIDDFSDEEFEAIVHMFMGARGYLSRRYSYSNGTVTAVPDHVISAYEKLITRGLFTPRGGDKQP
jgi:hypothetical protein